MPLFDPDPHPWCWGRRYCNAPAEMRIRCMLRSPPYWWIVNVTGVDPDPHNLNGSHLLIPYLWNTGLNPTVVWSVDTADSVGYVRLAYQRVTSDPHSNRVLQVQISQNASLSRTATAQTAQFDRVFNWGSFDGQHPVPVVYSVNWEGAQDVDLQIQIGEYSRLPAHSCRGDYKGPWS